MLCLEVVYSEVLTSPTIWEKPPSCENAGLPSKEATTEIRYVPFHGWATEARRRLQRAHQETQQGAEWMNWSQSQCQARPFFPLFWHTVCLAQVYVCLSLCCVPWCTQDLPCSSSAAEQPRRALAGSDITKSQSSEGSSRGHLLPSDIFMLQTLWTSTPDERRFMRDFCWLYDPPFNYMLKSSLLFNGLRSRPVGYKTVFYPLGRIRM